MPRRDLPFPEPRRPWWRRALARCRSLADTAFEEWGPLALGLEHGLAGVAVGVGLWLLFGLVWAALAAAGLVFAGLEARQR